MTDLEIALRETEADLANGNFSVIGVDEHIANLKKDIT